MTVHVAVQVDSHTITAGRLHSIVRRGRVASTFSYEPEYLADPRAYALEPALTLLGGTQPTPGALPRCLQDAAPDRWGRNLIAKRHRAEASADGRVAAALDGRDYLLGVSDETRQGALRVSASAGGPYLAAGTEVPKLVSLPRLLRAADAVAAGDDDLGAVKALLDAGTGSLGGARPKASVRDGDRLMIAKFPHPADEWDVMAWEKVALDLAESAGIAVPRSSLVDVGGRSVLLVERFDRAAGGRVGYISVMTLLESDDGDARDYLDIADELPVHSSRATADLRELFRRVAFNIAVHNTDDHLRNHGLLREGPGWRLSPAFDVNPNPEPAAIRVTMVGGASGPADEARALMRACEMFGLDRGGAAAIVREVVDAVRGWRSCAVSTGIRGAEVEQFSDVFGAGLAALESAVVDPLDR